MSKKLKKVGAPRSRKARDLARHKELKFATGKKKPSGKHCLTSDATVRTALGFYEALDTPLSLSCYLLLKYKEYRQLVEKDVTPLCYDDWDHDLFKRDLAAVSFLAKYPYFETGVDREEVAFKKFLKAEGQCLKTNDRFASRSSRTVSQLNDDSRLDRILHSAQVKIRNLLGDEPSYDAVRRGGWGPGATRALRKEQISHPNKFRKGLGAYKSSYSFVNEMVKWQSPTWFHNTINASGGVVIEPGGSLIFVPKNAKTDRSIVIEACLNTYFQKGVGRFLRERLRRWGIDLKHGQAKHAEMARQASMLAHLATVDFSAASDTIAIAVVEYLLPQKWFELLYCLRSSSVELPEKYGKKFLRLHKFSSMGNGFTFELETMIFASLAFACTEELRLNQNYVSVYGDDVILPTDATELFREVSEYCGFTFNHEKTHSKGAYRESCGAHYFNGVDCKPMFVKKRIKHENQVYRVANGIRRMAHRHAFGDGCHERFRPIWLSLLDGLSSITTPLKIPEGFGDGGLISNFDEAAPSPCMEYQRGFWFKSRVTKPVEKLEDGYGLLLTRLHGLHDSEDQRDDTSCSVEEPLWVIQRAERVKALALEIREDHNLSSSQVRTKSGQIWDLPYEDNYEAVRGKVKTKTKRLWTPTWYNLGPWIS